MKIQKILILTDFSEQSRPVLTYGLALAQSLGARVWVQHAFYIPPIVTDEEFMPVDVLRGYEKSIRNTYKKLIEGLPIIQEKEVPLVVSHGELVPVMNQLIDQENIDLVVTGNRGGGFLTNILGSNTIKVIHHAHCPVLSVPEETEFHPFKRIGLAVDLKETNPATIHRIVNLAQDFKSRVDMIHITEAPVAVDTRQLALSLDMFFQDVPHEFFTIHSSDVEKSVQLHAEKNNIDLLVMLPRVHNFFDRIFQKSVSRQVAYQKRIPLLTLSI